MKIKNCIVRFDDGWTFVETLIVMAIVLVLTTSVGVSSVKQIEKAKVVTAKSQIETFSMAIETFYLDNGVYPEQDVGLEILWRDENSLYENWNGPYISKHVVKDPWGRNYLYECPGRDGMEWSICSLGKDGYEGGSGYNEDIFSFR